MKDNKYPPINCTNDAEMVNANLRAPKLIKNIFLSYRSAEDRKMLKQAKKRFKKHFNQNLKDEFIKTIMNSVKINFNLGNIRA